MDVTAWIVVAQSKDVVIRLAMAQTVNAFQANTSSWLDLIRNRIAVMYWVEPGVYLVRRLGKKHSAVSFYWRD